MRFGWDSDGWPKLVAEREPIKIFFRFFNRRGRTVTVFVATLALVVGLLSIFVLEWLKWLRLVLSAVTLVFAVLTFSSLVELKASARDVDSGTAHLSIDGELSKDDK
jgi:cytochrome c biogenesis protein CcdA